MIVLSSKFTVGAFAGMLFAAFLAVPGVAKAQLAFPGNPAASAPNPPHNFRSARRLITSGR